MKQIIPFKKDLPFKTKVSEITSISLEREIAVEDDLVTGVFHITGDYKMNEGSINRENFSFDLPFDITLDPRYDVSTVTSDIEDFYYDVENEDTLKVNIDLFVEAEYLPESENKELEELCEVRKVPEELMLPDEKVEFNEEEVGFKEEDTNTVPVTKDLPELNKIKIEKDLLETISMPVREPDYNKDLPLDMPSLAADLFSNLDDTETYTTYYVYIVKEDDTIDKILVKYGVTKEELESYNNLSEIKPGDKVIIPKTSE